MPWNETDAMTQKRKFVFEAVGREKSLTEPWNEYGISTRAGCKWKARFQQSGWPGLVQQEHRMLQAPGVTQVHNAETRGVTDRAVRSSFKNLPRVRARRTKVN